MYVHVHVYIYVCVYMRVWMEKLYVNREVVFQHLAASTSHC